MTAAQPVNGFAVGVQEMVWATVEAVNAVRWFNSPAAEPALLACWPSLVHPAEGLIDVKFAAGVMMDTTAATSSPVLFCTGSVIEAGEVTPVASENTSTPARPVY